MFLNTLSKKCALVVILLGLSACAVGPDYHRPAVKTPAAFKEAKRVHWKQAEPQDYFDRGQWWLVFKDKKLNSLEARLNASNQSIATAYANYQQACALVDEARASYFPTVNLSASLLRQKSTGATSSTSNISFTNPNTGGSPGIYSTHSLIISPAWTPDLWGLVRRTVEASEAGAESSAALFANTRLAQQGSLAQYYFELRAVDMDQMLLNRTVKDDQEILKLTTYQYQSGVASRANVVQAQSQLETDQSTAINNNVNRALYEHAIAVLIGVPPADLSLKPMPLHAMPPTIPTTVPSILLERRPDVAQAERLMAQANAEIGVAIAAYFPTISLTANANSIGRGGLGDLFSVPTLGWAYGPQLAALIYDGGLRAATVRAARAGYDSAVASYRETVLAAFQNVEDNLATLRILGDQARPENAAADSARKLLKITMNEYQSGTVDLASVLAAKTTAYVAEKNAADVTGLRMTASVGLIMALGGGWNASAG